VKAPSNCRLIGRRRIVEADLWDRVHLDLCGPATLTISAQGGAIAFVAMEAGLEVEYARDSIGFPGPEATRETRSKEKEPPNSSTTARSRSSRLRQRRRSRPQSETSDFFNSLLGSDTDHRAAVKRRALRRPAHSAGGAPML
jgi:hypothetical protein